MSMDTSSANQPDRRAERLPIPPCTECGSPATYVASRTDYMVYVRCYRCAFLWRILKPAWRAVVARAMATSTRDVRARL